MGVEQGWNGFCRFTVGTKVWGLNLEDKLLSSLSLSSFNALKTFWLSKPDSFFILSRDITLSSSESSSAIPMFGSVLLVWKIN